MRTQFAVAAATGLLLATSACAKESATDASSSASTSSAAASSSPTRAKTVDEVLDLTWPSYEPAGSELQAEVVSTEAPLKLPESTSTSKAGVPTGFPKTPEGALAQLKAVDEAGMEGLNGETARAVFTDSFESGNPDFYQRSWIGPLTDKFSESRPGSYTATLNVSQGLIRGATDDGSFVLVCVVGKLQIVSKHDTQTVPAPDCEGMRWDGKRWMVVPRDTLAPDVSPHSSEAYRLGFRDLES